VLILREATEADIPVLERLGADTYRSHFATIWSPARMEAYIAAEYGAAALAESLARPDLSIWLIAEREREPVGFAKLNWDRPLPTAPDRSGIELQKIYFRAALTGQGLGGQALAAIVDRAKARGERLLWLHVLKSNAGARAFYARHGFDTVAEIPFATDLREIGMLVMAREL
jgi:ribosomal protein S18 acetylase RimI-like enzyme